MTGASSEVGLVLLMNGFEVPLQRIDEGEGKEGSAILVALSFADGEVALSLEL